jgi:hypothetical protein
MELRDKLEGFGVVITAALVLGLSFSFFTNSSSIIILSIISFLIIISLNIFAKKITAYFFESNIKTRFWSFYQFWFTQGSHFNKPFPMIWLPLLVSFLSRGIFLWLAVLEFEITSRVERVSKRHGLYRFSEITEWNMALIAASGVAINLFFAIIGYLISGYVPGAETFARLSIFYAFWSIIPFSSLDGAKILYGSRVLWITLFSIATLFLSYSMIIV